jgi:methyl-accepting chemotaxis protein
MKLQTRLLLAPCLTALVALAAAGANAWMADRSTTQLGESFQANFESFRTLTSAQDQLGSIQIEAYRTVVLASSLDDAGMKGARTSVQNQAQGLRRTLSTMAEDGVAADMSAAYATVLQRLDEFTRQVDDALDLASVDPNTGAAALASSDATFRKLTGDMGALVARFDAQAQSQMQDTVHAGRQTTAWLLGLGGLAMLITLIFSAVMLRRVALALAQATAVANEVAAGNLSLDTATSRDDEIGALQRGMGHMVEHLNRSLHKVSGVASDIAGAGGEIAAGNQDLSQRTEQAASSLQETVSSMEQLTHAVQQNADAAQQANSLAGSASDVARRGGEAVAKVVHTMEEINQASRRISDIIGVIDGIAFQTNILALNAAVEAARAGEQGRGFAVVASEVRSLAGRSAQAAREIKGLIGASVERVEDGTQQVQAAGETMQEIVASVNRVGQIIADISRSSREQSQGLGQINSTVSRLDQVTQQNAALVEQSAAAAESLKQQASQLGDVVAAFRLKPGTMR